jgi:adenylyl cyclase-associated protein
MWAEQRQVIMTATKCREPDQAGIMEIFAGVGSLMREIGSSVKRNTMENNIKTIFEGAQACNWMLVKPAPVDFMTSYIDGADMWSNRVRKEFKGVNEDHIAFCVLFKALMIGLRDYVKEFHRTGLAWNPKGMPLTEFFGSSLSSPVSSTVPALVKAAVVEADPAARVGMFAALNAGGAVTSGLKKVTKDQQTWRAEYKGEAPQPAAASKPKVAAASTVATGPPKFELKVLKP